MAVAALVGVYRRGGARRDPFANCDRLSKLNDERAVFIWRLNFQVRLAWPQFIEVRLAGRPSR